MYNTLLQQVPLTVSPFVSLPTATTLPYTYKSLPSTLPPSSTGPDPQQSQSQEPPKYIVSASGQSASPEDIIASCQKLQDHLKTTRQAAEKTVTDWEEGIKERELAEKRRLAPGWLDSDARILQPEPASPSGKTTVQAGNGQPAPSLMDAPVETARDDDAAGRELDRAFGGMAVKEG